MSVKCVPPLLPPLLGWGLLITYINFLVCLALRVMHLAGKGDGKHTAETTARALLVPLVVQALSVVIVFTDVQLLLCSNFLDKMLCVLGTGALCTFQLIAAVKRCLAGVLAELLVPGEPKRIVE